MGVPDRTSGYNSQLRYDNFIADLTARELQVLIIKKKRDLRYYRKRYGKKYGLYIDNPSSFWYLPLNYPIRRMIFREYKNLQQQYKMIREEQSHKRYNRKAINNHIRRSIPNSEILIVDFNKVMMGRSVAGSRSEFYGDSNDYYAYFNSDYSEVVADLIEWKEGNVD